MKSGKNFALINVPVILSSLIESILRDNRFALVAFVHKMSDDQGNSPTAVFIVIISEPKHVLILCIHEFAQGLTL